MPSGKKPQPKPTAKKAAAPAPARKAAATTTAAKKAAGPAKTAGKPAAVKKAEPAKKAAPPKKGSPSARIAPPPKASVPAKAPAPEPRKKQVAKAAAAPSKPAAAPAAPSKPAHAPAGKKAHDTAPVTKPSKSTAQIPAPAKKAAPVKKAAPAKKPEAAKKAAVPAPLTKTPYDAKFLAAQKEMLQEELAKKTRSAQRYEDEADTIIAEMEPGDVQFDEESGEGDMMVVERERDLALSATVRAEIAEIEAALQRIEDGTYGLSVISGQPIPKERLKAIPWASVRVEEKVGGIGTGR